MVLLRCNRRRLRAGAPGRQPPAAAMASHRVAAHICVAMILALATPQARAQDTLQARFDWSMPERFGGDLRTLGGAPGADGVKDYLVTFEQTWSDIDPAHPELGSPAVNPLRWRVDLDARASSGPIVSYRWEVDGVEVTTGASAMYAAEFPAEGRHTVTLTVADAEGATAATTAQVVVQDWLIVAIGDSYASGEGNPELGDLAWLEAILRSFNELGSAEAELASALETLRQAELGYQLTLDDVQPARAALNEWSRECPSISVACTRATAQLIVELGKLGFSEASELITKGFQYVKTQLDNLVNAAKATVDLAKAGVEAAQALVDGAKVEIDVLFSEGATWQTRPDVAGDRSSHRSSFSGQALAALAIERADSRTSVTFVHLAYSGARITKEPGSSALILDDGKAQVDDLLRLVGDREIDALLVSIGGNDTGFAKIVESLAASDSQICDRLRALVEQQCRDSWSSLGLPPALAAAVCQEVTDRFEGLCLASLAGVDIVPKEGHEALLREGLAKLRDRRDDEGKLIEPGRFTLLERYLADPARLPELPPSRLYFTEYPNLAEADDGSICPDYLTVTMEDWRWVRDVMTTDLNRTIREEATSRGWSFVDGIFAGFSGHGYCADDHWTYHPEESLLFQGDVSGAAHPTISGHATYGERIGSALLEDFYAGRDLSRPRAPGYGPLYRRGDTNDDGAIALADVVDLLLWLFLGEAEIPCLAAADSNADGALNISDATYLLGYLYLGGAEPAAPFQECGALERRSNFALACETAPRACR